MSSSSLVIQTSSDVAPRGSGPGARAARDLTLAGSPTWSLRIEGRRLAIVLQHAPLPGGAELGELVVHLPHVSFPFDFRDGIERFRHHRGEAESLEVLIDARVVLDWLYAVSKGQIAGSAQDDALVLAGRSPEGTRFTVRARLMPDRPDGRDGRDGREEHQPAGEPLLVLSLYQVRVYGPTAEPWPLLAGRILDLLPPELVAQRTLTTVKLRFVRRALAWALTGLGWKAPDARLLRPRGIELREGRFGARFTSRAEDESVATLAMGDDEAFEATRLRGAFERFVEDLELKRHHGQVDRLLSEGRTREALAEVYRALDGPARPGFLAERLIGICASQPVLFEEGERVCRELLEAAPSYEPALCGLVAIHLGRGRPDEAAVELERLADLTLAVPGTSDMPREDANAADLTRASLLAQSDPEASRGALERVLERAPDHEEALSGLIALAEAEGDLRRALPLYKRLLFAARSRDRTRQAGLRLARHALDRREPEDARVLLKVVLEAAPDDFEAQLALADVEAQEGHGQEAQRILEAALRNVPTSAPEQAVEVIVRLARLLLEALADPAKARRVLWRAGDLQSLPDASLVELAELAVRAREPVLALRYAGQLQPASPLWAPAQAVRARALVERGDTRAALTAITEVLKREPDSSEALELLERCAPDPSRRELLVHELHDSAKKVAAGAPRARILHRVAVLYESLGLRWDAVEPLAEAVFAWIPTPGSDTAADLQLADARAARLMDLQAEFGLWPDHQRAGALRLGWLPSRAEGEGRGTLGVHTRIDVLVALGRAALDELGDALAARPFLEEATRLSPRHAAANELLWRALEAQGAHATGPALVQALTRLETLRADDAGKDAARIRLAEVQLDVLGAPGQARATLTRLGQAALSDPRVPTLRARAGLVTGVSARPATGPVPSVAAPAPAPAPESTRPADLFLAAVRAADAGDGVAARKLLRQILTADPSFTPARELLVILPEDDSVERVEPTIAAKVVETDRIEAGLDKATERFFANDLPAARKLLDDVLALDPDVVPALELLVEVAAGQGDHRARARALERLVELVFDVRASATYLRQLADERHALGEVDGAHEARLRYLRLAPLDLATWDLWRGALDAAERADVLEARAEALEEAGEAARARATWQEAAHAYLDAGDPDVALIVAERAGAPDDPTTLDLVYRAERAAGRLDRAREAARRLAPLYLEGPERDALEAFAAG
ncbi:MAG: tetratricopeptide repeat protein [Deltaproteobacteria bacterium]|nr:tetratricopeptide repeat protein [Deltaproteobacteria bacterium]